MINDGVEMAILHYWH